MIKSLTIQNFRTYVEPTTLHFTSPFTAIIGPNGAGKSSAFAALQLAYSGNMEGVPKDAKVIIEFANFKAEIGSQQYLINDQQVSQEDFKSKLVQVLFPTEQVLIRQQQLQMDESSLEQLKVLYKQSSDAVTQQKKVYNLIKSQAEVAKQYQQRQKQLTQLREKILCYQLKNALSQRAAADDQIEQCTRQIQGIPIDATTQSLQQQQNSADTEILKLSFQKDQLQAKQAEIQPKLVQNRMQIQQFENKQLVIQQSIRTFAQKQQENEVTMVQVQNLIESLTIQLLKLQKNEQFKLPSNFQQLKISFNKQFNGELESLSLLRRRCSESNQQVQQVEKQLTKQNDQLEDAKNNLQRVIIDMKQIQAEKDKISAQLSNNQAQIQAQQKVIEDCTVKISNLQVQDDKVSKKITYLTQNSKLLQQQQRYNNICSNFKLLFRDKYHGPVKQLIKAVNAQIQPALSFAISALQNAIVVGTFDVAQLAIQELKNRKETPQTFIALETLEDQKENEHQYSLFKYVVRQQQYDNLARFVTRNTLLCPENENPRLLAKSTGFRVVTRDCKIFLPYGAIQAQIGGSSDRNVELDTISLDELVREKEVIDQKLQEYKNKRQLSELQIQQLEQLTNVEIIFKQQQVEQKYDQQQLEQIKYQQLIDNKNSLINSLLQQKMEQENQLEELQSGYQQQEQLVNDLKLQFFAPVIESLQIGPSEFLELESADDSNRQIDLQKQLITNQEKLRILKQQQYAKDIARFNDQLQKTTENLQQSRKELKITQLQQQENELQIQDLDRKLLILKQDSQNYRLQIEANRKQQTQQDIQLQELQNKLQQAQQDNNSSLQLIHQLVEQSFTEQIFLPSNAQNPRQLLKAFIQVPTDIIQFLSNTYKVDLDFVDKEKGSLPQVISEMQAQCIQLQSELNIDIDNSAVEKAEAEKKKLENLFAVQQQAKQKYVDQLKVQNQSEEEQLEKYQAYVKGIEEMANKYYQSFTSGVGQISITSDDLNVFQILVVPPGDGARNYEDLSGGEKALVDICLKLAYCHNQNCKILLLDECDANIDAERALIISQQIREICQLEALQIIAISHKPEFCQGCGSLCGIAKRPDEGAKSWWIWNK